MNKILVIDDEPGIREFMKMYFEERDYNVDIASDGQEGVELFEKGSYDLVLCDMLMPRMIGIQVLERIRTAKPDQKVIMMTGVKDETMVNKAKSLGCHLYLNKPVKLQELESRVAECFES
jgi:two-component system, NtrC family, nitrogen regulation response regulator NtrX